MSSAGTEYIYEEYNRDNYEKIDMTFAYIYFNNLISNTSSYEDVLRVYQDYINTMLVNNNKGVIINIDSVNTVLRNVLKEKNLQYDISDNLYDNVQISQMNTNNLSK